jgi:hypothetical protein
MLIAEKIRILLICHFFFFFFFVSYKCFGKNGFENKFITFGKTSRSSIRYVFTALNAENIFLLFTLNSFLLSLSFRWIASF